MSIQLQCSNSAIVYSRGVIFVVYFLQYKYRKILKLGFQTYAVEKSCQANRKKKLTLIRVKFIGKKYSLVLTEMMEIIKKMYKN